MSVGIIEGETDVDRLEAQVDNLVTMLNMSREGPPMDTNTFETLISATGFHQCTDCRRVLSKSTEGATPKQCILCDQRKSLPK